MTQLGEHAIVLGASMAGLAAAATLADRFDRVTIVDRDVLPHCGEQRDGVPQGRHAHLLLPAGGAALSELLPGVRDDLRRRDAHFIDATEFRFRIADGCLLVDDPGLEILGATRPLLESIVRERVQDLAGVRFRDERDVVGILTSPDRSEVTGVRLRSRASNAEDTVTGDLVVDATGRNSRAPRWMADLGYEAPAQERLHVGVHYTTRLFRRQPEDLDGCRHVAVTIPPGGRRGGLALAVEHDRWLVTLVGVLGERPPADLDGFVDYARTLWASDLHEVAASAQPVEEAATGGFPSYLRRRYDRLRRFPGRFVVTGDAVCSFNPVYAQGMTVAISQACALGQVLDRHGLDRVGQRFFQRTKRTVNEAWIMSTGADLGHPDVVGPRPARWRLINAYLNRLLRVAHHDPIVAKTFLEVSGMVAHPQHLMRPRIAWRVFTEGPSPARTSGNPEDDASRSPRWRRADKRGAGHGSAA
jgi:2-polyprenyl-6-methoxyphenol hydroxylase-like FAD-dependent oxidoreductase